MAQSETVSVVIPCYNGGAFLREAIDSALRQTHPPLEVIVVDDGSTDDSAAIAASYGLPVRVIRQRNQGESVARNAGIAAARGEYLVFLDADDLLAPTLLEAQSRSVEGVAKGVACSGFAYFSEDVTRAYGATMPRADRFLPAIIVENLGPSACWLVSKELVVQAGAFYAPQKYSEDWDLWWRLALTGAVYVPVNCIGFYYRRHAASQVARAPDADRAMGHATLMERMCRAFLDHEDLLQKHGETLFWSAWAALHRTRGFGVPWARLRPLGYMLEELARRGPPHVRRSVFGRAIRCLGIRRAEAIRALCCRSGKTPLSTASSAPTDARSAAVA